MKKATQDNSFDAPRSATERLLDRPLDTALLQERSERLARPLPAPVQDEEGLTVFTISSDVLGVPTASVLRVRPWAAVHRVPHRSNGRFLGLANIDGQLVPCACLASHLQLSDASAAATPAGCLLVIGEPAAAWAVRVDAVVGVFSVSQSTFKQPPITVDQARTHYTRAVVEVEQRPVAVLDTKRLLTDFEAALR